MLPNFFIVGAPKSGTTSLYHYLDQHPEIYMSPVKEPCYFASEVRVERLSDVLQAPAKRRNEELRAYLNGPMSTPAPTGIIAEWSEYLKLFRNSGAQKAVGEGSVCYLWSTTAAVNIHARVPDAKLIMILRNPADRAYSQYLQGVAGGLVNVSFRTLIERAMALPRGGYDALHPFLENGSYCDQVKRYFEIFPRENIQILWYEQDWRQPPALLTKLFRFLGVESRFEVDFTRRARQGRVPKSLAGYSLLKRSGLGRLVRRAVPQVMRRPLENLLFKKGPTAAMDPRDRSFLLEYYRDDIHHLSRLVERDLRCWLDPQMPGE